MAKIQDLTKAHQGEDLRAWVVFMGGPELKPSLEKLAAEKKIKIPITFLPGGPKQEDVTAYRINPAAKNTVLLYSRQEIRNTFVDVDDASFADVAKAAAAMVTR